MELLNPLSETFSAVKTVSAIQLVNESSTALHRGLRDGALPELSTQGHLRTGQTQYSTALGH